MTQEDIFIFKDIVREVTTEVVNSAVITSEERMMNQMGEKLGALEVGMDEKLGALEARMDEKLGALEARMDEKLEVLEVRMDEKLGALEARMDEKLENLEIRMHKVMDEKLENLEIRMRKVMDEKLHHTENMILQHVDSVQESIYKKMDELEKEIRTFKEYNHIAEMDSEEHKLMLKKITEMEQRIAALEKRKSLRILK